MISDLEPPPRLYLSYRDKYRLWVDLVRGRTDRLFVPTGERLPLGNTAVVDIQLADDAFPIEVHGTVIGWRPHSARFRQGVFLRLHPRELEKCRAFLRIEHLDELQAHARRNYRVRRNVPARLLEPATTAFVAAQNISESGLLLGGDATLRPGQRASLELHFDTTPLLVDAEVIWTNPERQVAGMQFVDLLPQTAAALVEQLDQLFELEQRAVGEQARRFVLVDTDDEAATLVVTALGRPGFEVLRCQRGDEAIDVIWQQRPALVIMDVLVPEIDGARICRMMRADAELVRIPVVLTSLLEPETLREVAQECGASDYLAKPFKIAELSALLAGYIKPG